MKVVISNSRAGLAQRTDIVKDPERAPVSRRDQVVVLYSEVVNRRIGQVQLQGLPVRTVIDREVHAGLGTGIKQTFDLGVFADGSRVSASRNARTDARPGLAKVVRLIDKRCEIVELVEVHSRVCGTGVEMRSLDDAYKSPFGHVLRRDVFPGLAVIARKLDEAVVGAGPEHSLL